MKDVICSSLTGIVAKKRAWDEAHAEWFRLYSKKLDDKTILDWIGKEEYFEGVDEIMKTVFANLGASQRTEKAREEFFETVIELLTTNDREEEAIALFDDLREKYKLILVTTNTQEAIGEILHVLELTELYDEIIASDSESRDSKEEVFSELLKEHKKPALFICNSEKTAKLCAKHNIPCVQLALNDEEGISGLMTFRDVHSLEEYIHTLG